MTLKNSHPKKKVAQAPVAVKSQSVSPDVADYLMALVEPASYDPVNVPSPLPYRRTNVREILEIDLKDHYVPTSGTGGECYVEIRPTVLNTVLISANAVEPVSTGILGFDISGTTTGNDNPIQPNAGYMTRGCVQTMHSFGGRQAFELTSDSASQTLIMHAGLIKSSVPSTVLTLHLDAFAGGDWVSVATTSVNGIFDGTVSGVLPGDVEAVGFRVSSTGLTGVNYEISLQLQNFSGTGLGCPNIPESQTVKSMQLLENIPSLEQFGVTALSALATYQGSDLQNGGKIYSAWVPEDWAPPRDVQLAMSQLVYDRYDGPLKKGTHCHWVPQDLDELELSRPNGSKPINKKLVIYIICDDLSQSTRLRICQHQQYYTQLASFGTMNFGPSCRTLSTGLSWLVCNVPMCTENDEHFAKKVLKLMNRGGKRALRYAIEHPEQIAKVASLLI